MSVCLSFEGIWRDLPPHKNREQHCNYNFTSQLMLWLTHNSSLCIIPRHLQTGLIIFVMQQYYSNPLPTQVILLMRAPLIVVVGGSDSVAKIENILNFQ